MKDIKNVFRNLENKLKTARWFNDDWEIYNRGPYLQLYKSNWHNHNQGGVHFESFIEGPQIKQKNFPVCLHAEEDCPSQSRFMEELLALEAGRINNWKGCHIIGSGYTIFEKVLPLNFKNLEQRLYDEFNQLRQLEESIDQVLASL